LQLCGQFGRFLLCQPKRRAAVETTSLRHHFKNNGVAAPDNLGGLGPFHAADFDRQFNPQQAAERPLLNLKAAPFGVEIRTGGNQGECYQKGGNNVQARFGSRFDLFRYLVSSSLRAGLRVMVRAKVWWQRQLLHDQLPASQPPLRQMKCRPGEAASVGGLFHSGTSPRSIRRVGPNPGLLSQFQFWSVLISILHPAA
jgi:hypothetical protein